MIRAYNGHAECCLDWNAYDISVKIVNFKENTCNKMNVIAKISRYLERSVVILKLRKECLNTVTYNTSVLLCIKN